jgi:hypothetical protein
MLLPDSKRTSILAYPMIASAAIILFLLRNRQITHGNSPGSGVTIALGEVLSRFAALAHSVVSAGYGARSLLLRVALAPAHAASTTLQSELWVVLNLMQRVDLALHPFTSYVRHLF